MPTRSTIFGAVLALVTASAASQVAADHIGNGVDLLQACSRLHGERPGRIDCESAIVHVVRGLDWPQQAWQQMVGGTFPIYCPNLAPDNPLSDDWRQRLPGLIRHYWKYKSPDPGRLAILSWDAAIIEALVGLHPGCANVAAS